MKKSWQAEAALAAEKVIREVGLQDPIALRTALQNAYPFGDKLGPPYRAWLREIEKQIHDTQLKEPDPAQLDFFEVGQSEPKNLAR